MLRATCRHAAGLQPHRVETFKLSKDPLFIEKVRDIVGLCLTPPDRALVPGTPPCKKTLDSRACSRPDTALRDGDVQLLRHTGAEFRNIYVLPGLWVQGTRSASRR